MVRFLEKISPYREKYAGKEKLVEEILFEGSRKARIVAQVTLQEARKAMKIDYGR